MNKTEKKLVDALHQGNYENAKKALLKFTDLPTTTDDQSNEYFDKVEALAEVVLVDDAIAEELVEEAKEVQVFQEVAPRVETRGSKPKSKERKQVEKDFNNALESAMNYRDENRRTEEARFALRLVRQLSFISKRLFR